MAELYYNAKVYVEKGHYEQAVLVEDGIIRRIFAQLGYETPVVATGGLASRVAAQSQTITAINPELTLEGLRLVYEAQEGAASV